MWLAIYLPIEALKARKGGALPGQQAFDFSAPATPPEARGLHLEQRQVGGHTQGVWVKPAEAPETAKPHQADIDHADLVSSLAHLINGPGLSKIEPGDENKVKLRLIGMGLGRTCGRCGGTGQFSSNQIDGTVCYGCNGHGDVPPRLTPDLVTEVQQAVAGGALDRYLLKVKGKKRAGAIDSQGSMGEETDGRTTTHVLAEWDLTDGGVRQVVSRLKRYPDGSPVGPSFYSARDMDKGDPSSAIQHGHRGSTSFEAAVHAASKAGGFRRDGGQRGSGVAGAVRSNRPEAFVHHHIAQAERARDEGRHQDAAAHTRAADMHKRGDPQASEATAAAHARRPK